jgi:hypothetical protein
MLSAEAHALFMRLPGQLVIRQALEALAGGDGFLLDLGEDLFCDAHTPISFTRRCCAAARSSTLL